MVTVRIYEVEAYQGKLSRRYIKQMKVMPPLLSMTNEEFNSEFHTILSSIPQAFRDFVGRWSYEHGHSCGYEEVLGIARDLVYELKPAIEKHEQEGWS